MFYLVLVLAFVATVAAIWIEISGTDSRGVANDLREKQMVIKVGNNNYLYFYFYNCCDGFVYFYFFMMVL
jgi:hypothetical protein